MITSRDLKRHPVSEPMKLRHLTTDQVSKNPGGPFNFNRGRYTHATPKTPNRVKGTLFSSDLRAIQEAKERKEKEAAIAQSKALRAKALAEVQAAKIAKAQAAKQPAPALPSKSKAKDQALVVKKVAKAKKTKKA